MKHFVNSANVGIKFRTGVPFFAENHCRVNQLFNIYSVLDSQYIVCFQEKAFHTYCLTGSEQRFFAIGYVGFFYGKIPCLFLLFKITNGRTQLLFAVFYPLITLAFSLLMRGCSLQTCIGGCGRLPGQIILSRDRIRKNRQKQKSDL